MTRKQQRLLYTVLLIGGGFYVWSQFGPQIAEWFSGLGGGGGSTETPPDDNSGTIFGTLAGILESLGGLDLSGVFDGLFDGTLTLDVPGLPDSIIPPIDPPDNFVPDLPRYVPEAVAFSLWGIGKVMEQGEHWGDIYSALTEEEQAQASKIVGVEPGQMAIPSSVKQQHELLDFALSVDNETAEALLNPAEKEFLDQYARLYA